MWAKSWGQGRKEGRECRSQSYMKARARVNKKFRKKYFGEVTETNGAPTGTVRKWRGNKTWGEGWRLGSEEDKGTGILSNFLKGPGRIRMVT